MSIEGYGGFYEYNKGKDTRGLKFDPSDQHGTIVKKMASLPVFAWENFISTDSIISTIESNCDLIVSTPGLSEKTKKWINYNVVVMTGSQIHRIMPFYSLINEDLSVENLRCALLNKSTNTIRTMLSSAESVTAFLKSADRKDLLALDAESKKDPHLLLYVKNTLEKLYGQGGLGGSLKSTKDMLLFDQYFQEHQVELEDDIPTAMIAFAGYPWNIATKEDYIAVDLADAVSVDPFTEAKVKLESMGITQVKHLKEKGIYNRALLQKALTS